MKGQVIQSTGSWYVVRLATDSKPLVKCRIKGKFRLQHLNTTNPVAVGDEVMCEPEPKSDNWIITELLPRRNYIIRNSPHSRRQRHIIAANIDRLLIIVTFSQPRTSTGFIDRLLVNAEMYQIPAVLVFNKQDIYTDEEVQMYEIAKAVYGDNGYGILLTSAETGYGMDDLQNLLKDNISLVSGHSGVGKSSLINYLCPDRVAITTTEISEYSGKGQHTTTVATMHDLPLGGAIIDTPGIKEFALGDLKPAEIAHFFPEIRALLPQCKFNNCTHRHEPHCAVRKAVEENYIVEWRYNNYLNLLNDLESVNYWELG
jgi:ribosome biogenesis GTPase